MIMEEAAFQSPFPKTSGSMSLASASDSANTVSGTRVAALAVIICISLMAMAGLVVALIITTSDIPGGDVTVARTYADIDNDPLANSRPSAAKHSTPATPERISSTSSVDKEIICTVSETASSESMYPPDKYCDYLFYIEVYAREGRIASWTNTNGWNVFRRRARTYKIMKLGISFDFFIVKPEELDKAAGDLSALRREGIKHYGLLTALVSPSAYSELTSRAKPFLEKLKLLQGSDQTAKTVIAIGSDDYSGDFLSHFADIFTEVANTYAVDIVIAISSVGSIGYETCNALPPTALTSTSPCYEGLLHHWHVVSPTASYTRATIQTGLSFDLSTLVYELVERTSSLNESLSRPCKTSRRTSRDVFKAGVKDQGIRQRTAWLFYNVHLQDFKKQCREPPYTVLRLFCVALKGPSDERCE
ncbi:uncharacterized protein [Dermacentor albipictus]|uniref:uncharacterized protein isoform X2 n=1 Tax=Dermacentor albipictus TaxID=60249 RepID=UPI0038FC4684